MDSYRVRVTSHAALLLIVVATACTSPSEGVRIPEDVDADEVLEAHLPLPSGKFTLGKTTFGLVRHRVTWVSEEPRDQGSPLCEGATTDRLRLWTEVEGGSTAVVHVCEFGDPAAAADAFDLNVESLPSYTDLPNFDSPESVEAARVDTTPLDLQSESSYLTCGIDAWADMCGAWIFISLNGPLVTTLSAGTDAGGFTWPAFARAVRAVDAAAGAAVR